MLKPSLALGAVTLMIGCASAPLVSSPEPTDRTVRQSQVHVVPAIERPGFVLCAGCAATGVTPKTPIQGVDLTQTASVPASQLVHIRFAHGGSTLDEAATRTLSELIDQLKGPLDQGVFVRIGIVGYTDNTGSARINHQLAQARSDAVRRVLSQQLDTSRVRLSASADPLCCYIADNNTEHGRAQNRRVVLTVTFQR